jgi:hypothetical protein
MLKEVWEKSDESSDVNQQNIRSLSTSAFDIGAFYHHTVTQRSRCKAARGLPGKNAKTV